MTKSSSKDKKSNPLTDAGPHARAVELIMGFEPLCVAMIEDMNGPTHNISPEHLAELLNYVGELVWMAGAIEACTNMAMAEQEGLIKVVH